MALIVTNGGLGADEADRAIGLADAEFRGRTDWRGAIDRRFDHPGPIELVAVEAQGVPDDMLAAALPRLAALRGETGARFVVALDQGQIDLVAEALLGERVELLCEPTLADRAAAFLIGLSGFSRDTLHDRKGDGESAQLRQLNEEVARISRVLSRLANEDKRPGGLADRSLGFTPPPATPAASNVTAADVRKIIRGRRLRNQFFADGLFEDPAWDMLLDLYAAELEGAQVSVSSLCIAAAVAPTTALRWIGRMTDVGLFVRQPDPFDRRRAFLGLSAEARAKMESYLTALRQGGFAAL
ncbi:MAG: winged helix-turn-helix transcriptional regulator [Sphingomonas sp.]|uniref:MarR family winged helix-turn-helix transcriptional regulator n=1 Tax=Sphingomonas sp. TaxID=28214 RepID=UPI001AD3A59E|nr:MarR family winged helix-turn-helix transcriptional regulator [Sphingomonas sp.]MBN8816983.1 winged helix-turn-helix transcriptional regulator [Sphingomonas sp.]